MYSEFGPEVRVAQRIRDRLVTIGEKKETIDAPIGILILHKQAEQYYFPSSF